MCRSRCSVRTSPIRIWSPTGSSSYTSGCAWRSTRSGSPITSAASASAAARLPTPRGPWKRYACVWPSASDARRRRLASGCSGKVSKLSINESGERFRVLGAVDSEDTAREELRELAVGAIDLGDELVVLALDPVGALRVALAGLGGVDEQ